MSARVTLQIGDREGRVPVAQFVKSLEALNDMLRSAEETIPDRSPSTWMVVDLHHSMPTVVIEPVGSSQRAEVAVSRMSTWLIGLAQRKVPERVLPNKFLGGVRTLIDATDDWRRTVTIEAADTTIHVSADMKASLDAYEADVIRAEGTIEGYLEAINVHGRRPVFSVYERVTGHRVDCRFDEELLPTLATLLRHRVWAHGVVTYRRGQAVSMDLDGITDLPESDGFSVAEFAGIGKDWYGKSSVEYVRDLWRRDGPTH